MFKRISKSFRLRLLPNLPDSKYLPCGLDMQYRDHSDKFFARHNPNLGGWV